MAITNSSGQFINTSGTAFIERRNTGTNQMATATQINWSGEILDQHADFENVTNAFFTVPVTGSYLFSISAFFFNYSGTISAIGFDIVPSSGNVYRINGFLETSTSRIAGSIVIPLTSGQTVFVRTFIAGGGIAAMQGKFISGNHYPSWWSCILVA